MSYRWTDSLDIALDLIEIYPDVDPMKLHFPELMQWVIALENFDDDPSIAENACQKLFSWHGYLKQTDLK